LDFFAARARSRKIAATASFSALLRGVKTSRSSMLQRDLSPEFTGRGTLLTPASKAPMNRPGPKRPYLWAQHQGWCKCEATFAPSAKAAFKRQGPLPATLQSAPRAVMLK